MDMDKKKLRNSAVVISVVLLVLVGGYVGYVTHLTDQSTATTGITSGESVEPGYIIQQDTDGYSSDVVMSVSNNLTFSGFAGMESSETMRYDSDTHIVYTKEQYQLRNLKNDADSTTHRSSENSGRIRNSRISQENKKMRVLR